MKVWPISFISKNPLTYRFLQGDVSVSLCVPPAAPFRQAWPEPVDGPGARWGGEWNRRSIFSASVSVKTSSRCLRGRLLCRCYRRAPRVSIGFLEEQRATYESGTGV